MIKVTHINQYDEDKVAKMIADYLHKEYRYYFEVKTNFDYAGARDGRKKLKITSRDYENENIKNKEQN